jgi:hypothetical protein
MKGYHFGKLLEKCSIISEYPHKVIVYQAIKGIIRDKNKADSKSRYILLSAYYQHLLSGDIILIFTYLNTALTV